MRLVWRLLHCPRPPINKKRHETLQRFMLINVSVTVAVEIPVFLTRDDVNYYRMSFEKRAINRAFRKSWFFTVRDMTTVREF
jgi:hypothetical protein